MITQHNRAQLGMLGEQAVADYLIKQGFTILARNYKQRCGEIDLIARKQDILAFVEVKTRTYHHIAPSDIVVPAKQQKIVLTAHYFIQEHRIIDSVYRFDIAFVTQHKAGLQVDYVTDAFSDHDE